MMKYEKQTVLGERVQGLVCIQRAEWSWESHSTSLSLKFQIKELTL